MYGTLEHLSYSYIILKLNKLKPISKLCNKCSQITTVRVQLLNRYVNQLYKKLPEIDIGLFGGLEKNKANNSYAVLCVFF